MDGFAFPKPIPRDRKAKRWAKKPARRKSRPGADPGRLEFCRWLPCVGLALEAGHVCLGPTEASHLRHHTGIGRKEPDRKTVPKCSKLHRQWEAHSGPFSGWTNAQRYAFMLDAIHEVNLLWDKLSEQERDEWQGRAELARRRWAEALRGT